MSIKEFIEQQFDVPVFVSDIVLAMMVRDKERTIVKAFNKKRIAESKQKVLDNNGRSYPVPTATNPKLYSTKYTFTMGFLMDLDKIRTELRLSRKKRRGNNLISNFEYAEGHVIILFIHRNGTISVHTRRRDDINVVYEKTTELLSQYKME